MVEITDKFMDFKKMFQNMFTNAKDIKMKLKPKKNMGRLLWDSSARGTYIKKIHDKISPDDVHIYEELKHASNSNNKLLSILLNCKNEKTQQNIIISTYHMPCMFMKKYYISSHIHAIKQHLDILYAFDGITQTIIFSGDLNITPCSPEYNLLLNREAKELKILAECYTNIGQNLYSGLQFTSAYKTKHNREPLYTNVSVQTNKQFIECIDYILTNNIKIHSCLVGLISDDPVKRPYPNALCPSDHLPLSASLII